MTKTPDPSITSAKARLGGGAAAQLGFDYQLDVSILAALRLLLITKSARRITLEPANEEDLEADLEPDRPGRVQPVAMLDSGYRLVIQIKRRSGEPWSSADFDALLKHGKARTPAKDHLNDEDVHFLLVTSADAKGVLRDLLVKDFEEPSDPDAFPASLQTTLTKSPKGRVAIWGGLSDELLAFKTAEVLTQLLRIPQTRLNDCINELRAAARRRMRGTVPGVWTRDDLLATIRTHGGYLASAPELATFIEPANFLDMVEALNEQSAIVISGPSGTGKTLAALALCEDARRRNGRLEIVTVNANEDPSHTRRLVDRGPTLFYVEDPWGQYSLRAGAGAWTEQLPRLLRHAHPDHQYVITSRSDMLRQARAGEGLKPWAVTLDADQYRGGELSRIYDKRMDVLATDRQAIALEFRENVLATLETPLEIDLFFTNLADGPQADEKDHALLQRLLKLAHRDAVEEVVVRYLTAIDSLGASAIIWALLAARGQFDHGQLTALQRALRPARPELGDALSRTVDRLVATRHLRQPARTISFAHPSVRAGFETFLRENWLGSEEAIQLAISALADLAPAYRDWGLETAARMMSSTMRLTAGLDEPPFAALAPGQAAIDVWLGEALLDQASDFQSLLELAAHVGSAGSIPAELARWFINGVKRGPDFFLDGWKPPVFDDAWYARIAADPRSAQIADRFVREQLPSDHAMFGRSFPGQLDGSLRV